MRTNERDCEGNEILRNRGGRSFTFHGRKFYVADLCKADMKDGNKYLLEEIREGGRIELMHNSIGWELLKFKTIKDARAWVRDWEWCTKAWNDYQG